MKKRFQILSLDGGGIKGLFSAALLAHIEEDLKTDITNHFDLIVGTSTGGIIALGLGLGIRAREITDFYLSEGPNIFSANFFERLCNPLKNLWEIKYDNCPLKSALKKYFNDKLLGDSQKRLVIPSYTLGDDDVYLFKTSHHERFKRDYKVPAWKVALATSAAPTFFPSFNEVENHRLIDGGIWANNPIMVAFTEAVGILKIDPNDISIFSVGTSSEILNRPKNLDNGGLWTWRKHALDVAFRGQSRGAINQVALMIGKDKILRLNPKVPENLFELDKISPAEHLSKAAFYSRHITPEIERRFLNHQAEVFNPYHRVEKE